MEENKSVENRVSRHRWTEECDRRLRDEMEVCAPLFERAKEMHSSSCYRTDDAWSAVAGRMMPDIVVTGKACRARDILLRKREEEKAAWEAEKEAAQPELDLLDVRDGNSSGYMDAEKLAAILGIAVRTVYRRMKQGKIEGIDVGGQRLYRPVVTQVPGMDRNVKSLKDSIESLLEYHDQAMSAHKYMHRRLEEMAIAAEEEGK